MTTVFACKCGQEYETVTSFSDELPEQVHECVLCGEYGCTSCLRMLPNSHDFVHVYHTPEQIHDFEIMAEG